MSSAQQLLAKQRARKEQQEREKQLAQQSANGSNSNGKEHEESHDTNLDLGKLTRSDSDFSITAAPAPPPIVPFGEYVRQILGLSIDTELGRLAAKCATLYIFRNNPEELKRLMRQWYGAQLVDCTTNEQGVSICKLVRAVERKSISGLASPPPASPTSPNRAKDAFELWTDHICSVLQNCVERYFSINWDQQQRVVRSNIDYKSYLEELDSQVVEASRDSGDADADPNAVEAGSSLNGTTNGELKISRSPKKSAGSSASHPPGVLPRPDSSSLPKRDSLAHSSSINSATTPNSRPRRDSASSNNSRTTSGSATTTPRYTVPVESLKWVNNATFDQEVRRYESEGIVVVFHAEFSEPSCEFLRLIEALQRLQHHKLAEKARKRAATPESAPKSPKETKKELGVANSSVVSPMLREQTAEGRTTPDQSERTQSTIESPKRQISSPVPEGAPNVGDLTKQHVERLPHIVVVDAPKDFQLFSRFEIKWFPTIMFIHQGQYTVYPETGVIRQPRFLLEWFASKGKSQPHTKRIKQMVTKAAMLKAKNKYAAVRSLHSAVMMIGRLQCDSCSNGERRNRTEDDPPLFIFLGGGMAAGKTTAVTWLSRSDWWSKHGKDTVTVDADSFKHADPLFNAPTSDVHQKSTESAELLLVSALNQGRDIVFDGTMMWEPFVRQTVHMIRDSRKFKYKRGPGYDPKVNGVPGGPEEQYWEVEGRQDGVIASLPPYRIQLVGVEVDPRVGVLRAILRQLTSGRSVPVKQQLRSYKWFCEAFEKYAAMCDEVVLFNNNIHIDLDGGQSPFPCARKELGSQELEIVDQEAWEQFKLQSTINDDATSADEVFPPQRTESSYGMGSPTTTDMDALEDDFLRPTSPDAAQDSVRAANSTE